MIETNVLVAEYNLRPAILYIISYAPILRDFSTCTPIFIFCWRIGIYQKEASENNAPNTYWIHQWVYQFLLINPKRLAKIVEVLLSADLPNGSFSTWVQLQLRCPLNVFSCSITFRTALVSNCSKTPPWWLLQWNPFAPVL